MDRPNRICRVDHLLLLQVGVVVAVDRFQGDQAHREAVVDQVDHRVVAGEEVDHLLTKRQEVQEAVVEVVGHHLPLELHLEGVVVAGDHPLTGRQMVQAEVVVGEPSFLAVPVHPADQVEAAVAEAVVVLLSAFSPLLSSGTSLAVALVSFDLHRFF